MNCRYCDKPIPPSTEVITHSYWQGMKFHCHAECKQRGEREEAIECQTVDADCNDCVHFQRGKLVQRQMSGMVAGKAQLIVVNMGIFTGHCLKFDQPTQAFPKKWTGRECFTHRRCS